MDSCDFKYWQFLVNPYTGNDSSLTKVAAQILETCNNELAANEEHLAQLEKDIAVAQEAALDAAEAESFSAAPNTPMSGYANDDSMTGKFLLSLSYFLFVDLLILDLHID